MAEWSIASDCKSDAFGLRRFESCPAHTNKNGVRSRMLFLFVFRGERIRTGAQPRVGRNGKPWVSQTGVGVARKGSISCPAHIRSPLIKLRRGVILCYGFLCPAVAGLSFIFDERTNSGGDSDLIRRLASRNMKTRHERCFSGGGRAADYFSLFPMRDRGDSRRTQCYYHQGARDRNQIHH